MTLGIPPNWRKAPVKKSLSVPCLLVTMTLSVPFAAAGTISLEEAINQAGRERMLTQRMIKAYAMIGQRVSIGRGYEQLDAAIERFDSQLRALGDVVSTSAEKTSLKKLARLWKRLRNMLDGKPRKAAAAKLDAQAAAVMNEADHLVGLLEKRSKRQAGRLTNRAGRQRMLTQRMAKFYLLRSWGLNDPAYRRGFDDAVGEFASNLRALRNSPANSEEINGQLDAVERQWRLFGMNERVGKRFVPSLVVRSLDNILERMEAITTMYAKLGK